MLQVRRFQTLSGFNIGRSCYDYGDFVVDFGATQGDGKNLLYPPMPLEPKKLVLISHDHLDHCGGMAIFAREHPEARIVTVEMTMEGMTLQLYDSLKIAVQRRKMDELRGLNPKQLDFTEQDIEHLLGRVECVLDESWHELISGYRFSFRSAGHKPGAAIILIEMPDGKRLVHACDYSVQDQALVYGVKVPDDFKNPDLLVTECTYGNRSLPDRVAEETKLVGTVRQVLDRGGKVVIPHFSSTGLNVALPLARAGITTYIDGMIRDFQRLCREIPSWTSNDRKITEDDYRFLRCVDGGDPRGDYFQRRQMIGSTEPFVVVASSGALQGGPAVQYVEGVLEDSKNCIILPGYQAPETAGRKLLQLMKGDEISFTHERIARNRGVEYVETRDEKRKILCDVIQLHLSGHSDGDTMADWICKINPRKVVTIHGDPEGRAGLARRINERNAGIYVETGVDGKSIAF